MARLVAVDEVEMKEEVEARGGSVGGSPGQPVEAGSSREAGQRGPCNGIQTDPKVSVIRVCVCVWYILGVILVEDQ